MINNVEDIFAFPDLNVFNSDNSFILSCGRNAQVTFVEKPQLKIKFINIEI